MEETLFYDPKALRAEQLRVFDICNGCRRCFNLCPSFEILFNRIDAGDGELELLTPKDHREITDLCYYCKLCYNHCPYTPPHHFNLDFPRLMLRGKAVEGKEGRPLFRDRFLTDTDRVGKLSARFAPLINWGLKNRPIRLVLQRFFGIHKDRILPKVHAVPFEKWLARQAPARPEKPRGKIALFHTCAVNYNYPDIGKDAVAVLKKNEVEILSPPQVCCGMPFFDIGDLDAARSKARANLASLRPAIEAGYDIVPLMPTCSLMLKKEYPALLGEDARPLAERTFDVCEYLMRLHGERGLSLDFTRSVGKVAYQIPCHLRDQNIGYKSRDLMRLIPGSRIEVIERCSAHDGTWGIKTEYFEASMRTAKPLFREIETAGADLVSTDCPLAGNQIEQGCGVRPLHPIQVLRKAYGI
jgi:Fe-S oxidoreductase